MGCHRPNQRRIAVGRRILVLRVAFLFIDDNDFSGHDAHPTEVSSTIRLFSDLHLHYLPVCAARAYPVPTLNPENHNSPNYAEKPFA